MNEFFSFLESQWGLDLILWFQSWRTPLVETIFKIFTFTGEDIFYLLFLPMLYWCINERVTRRIIPVFLLSAWSNFCLKETLQRPRPSQFSPDKVKPAVDVGKSFGIPSGHSQGATALWGSFAVYFRRWYWTIILVFYISLVCISRLVLGAHYPQDVVMGILLGILWVCVYAFVSPKVGDWLSNQSLSKQILLTVIVSAVLFVIHPVLIRPASGHSLIAALLPIGLLVGMGIGFALEIRYVRFTTQGAWWKRSLRFVIGIAGMILLNVGISMLLGENDSPVIWDSYKILLPFVLTGLWVGYGAPWLFVKARLANKLETGQTV